MTVPDPSGALLRSPIHDRHVAAGAKFAAFGGWSMPLEYAGGGVLAEHAAVRDAVGIFDVSHLGKARITGPGAAEFANRCLTGDLAKIGPGPGAVHVDLQRRRWRGGRPDRLPQVA